MKRASSAAGLTCSPVIQSTEKTREVLKEDGWFVTGTWDESTRWISVYRGTPFRFSKTVEKWFPGSVEEAVMKVLGLSAEEDPVCVVAGIEDETKGAPLVLLLSSTISKSCAKISDAGLPNL